MRLFQFSVLFIAIIVFSGCGAVAPGPKGATEVEGFKPFPSVRSFDKPGRIFRVDPDGAVHKVAVLDVEPQVGEEILPKVSAVTKLSLELVLETIGVAAAQVPGNLYAKMAKSREFVTESVDGKREFIDDSQVDPLLKRVFQDITIRPRNRYYLIRETILSRKLNYRSEKSWLVDAGLEGEFKKVVKGKAGVNFDDQKEFSLNKTFDQPMRIWYKAERLIVEQPLGVGPGQPMTIKTVKINPDEFSIPGGDVSINP